MAGPSFSTDMFIAAEEPPSTSTEDNDKQKSIDKEKGHRKNRALIVDLETLEEALQMMVRDAMKGYTKECIYLTFI